MKEELHIAVLAEGAVENPLVEVITVPLNGTLHSMYKAVSMFEDTVMRWCKTELPGCENHLEEILKKGSYVDDEYRIVASVVKVGEFPNEMVEELMQQEPEATTTVGAAIFEAKAKAFCAAFDRKQKWRIVTADLLERLARQGFSITGVSNGEYTTEIQEHETQIEHLLGTDEGKIFVKKGPDTFFLLLIYSNGYGELVADHSYKANNENCTSLEAVINSFYDDWESVELC